MPAWSGTFWASLPLMMAAMPKRPQTAIPRIPKISASRPTLLPDAAPALSRAARSAGERISRQCLHFFADLRTVSPQKGQALVSAPGAASPFAVEGAGAGSPGPGLSSEGGPRGDVATSYTLAVGMWGVRSSRYQRPSMRTTGMSTGTSSVFFRTT